MQQEQKTQLTTQNSNFTLTKKRVLKLDYNNIQKENITNLGVSEKSIPNDKSGGKYKEIRLGYKYPTEDGKGVRIDTFDVEYPKILCSQGISEKEENDGRISYSMRFSLDPNDNADLIKKVEDIYMGTAVQIDLNKNDLGDAYEYFQVDRPFASGYKSPLYYSKDKVTKKVIPGRKVSQYIKLFNYGPANRSNFINPIDGGSIDWSLLIGAELEIIPLIRYEKIYCGGGKLSLQTKLISAVLVSAEAPNSQVKQQDTIDKIREDESLVEDLRQQLMKLQAKYQELENNSSTNKDSKDQETSNTLEFPTVPDTETTQSNMGKIQSITPQADLQSVLNNQPKSESPQHSPTQTSQVTTTAPVVVPKPTLPSVTTSQPSLPIPASSKPVQLPISTQSVPLPSTDNTTEQVSTIPLPSL